MIGHASPMAHQLVRKYLLARATIRRKDLATGTWVDVHADVPCSVTDTTATDGSPDPADAGTSRRQTWDVMLLATDPRQPRTDDQLRVTVGGVPLPLMLATHVGTGSMRLLTGVACAAEETAVERYRVTALRRDTATGLDATVGPWDVSVTLDDNRIATGGAESVATTRRVGTITGAAGMTVEVGDVLVGLPAPLTACVVLDVRPAQLEQREATFAYSVGQGV